MPLHDDEVLLRVQRRVGNPRKLASSLVNRAISLTLPYHERSKSRLRTRLDDGREIGIVLPHGSTLHDGDVLVAADGTLIRVVAASEEVLEAHSENANVLVRAAYHLGNRHIPVQLGNQFVRLEIDAVLEQMLSGLGLATSRRLAAFEPETGAYAGGHRHGHDATFAEDYAMAQAAFEEHHGHADEYGSHAHSTGGVSDGRDLEGDARHHQRDHCCHHHDQSTGKQTHP